MAKKFPANRIKSHRVYNVWEVADALGCHKQTVTRWINKSGLIADTSQKPWLIDGRDLKSFLGQKQTNSKCKLALHHCYCFGCREPREPDGKIADYIQQTAESGRLTGLCPACGALMNKVIKRADLEAVQAKIEVTIQKASPRLVSRGYPLSKVTYSQEQQTHDKAQQR